MSMIRRIAAVGAALIGLIAAFYGQCALVERTATDAGTWMLIAGCMLSALAITVLRPPAPPLADVPRFVEAIVVGVILSVGVWMRAAAFDRIPEGINHDGAWNAMYATAIRLGADFTPYVAAAWGRETLFMYVIAPFQHWLGNSAAAIQAASIATGVAALLPLYLLARDLFGRMVAIAALAFFSVSGWHWVFSQVGWRCVTVPPFETLALYFLWRSLRRGGLGWWLCAGGFTAASIYTYNAGRIVPAMIGMLALWYLVTHRDRWRAILGGGLVATTSFALVGSSMLVYAANNWVKFQGRAAHLLDTSQRQTGVLENLSTALWMFNFNANGNDFFVSEPLLEPLAAVLFVVGVALLLARLRQAPAQFVLLGLLLSLVPGLLSFPNGNRCITAMPFVYVIVGYAGAELARSMATPFRGSAARWVTGIVLLGCFGQAALATYGAYLGDQRRELQGLSASATAVGEYLGRFGEDYRVYAVSGAWPRYTLFYLGFTHGDPLEPDIVVGNSFPEIETQISRFGRKGLVLVAGLDRDGNEAREGIKRIFADVREESVRASRLGGEEVARAVVVEPREVVRTAPWSNRSRVLAVSTGEEASASGSRCFEARLLEAGFSARFRMMIPEVPPTGSVGFDLSGECPSSRGVVSFRFTGDGLVLDGPSRHVLLPLSGLQGGRWHDLGLAIDRSGNTRAMIDDKVVELGLWEQRPARITGFVVALSGPVDGSPKLYVDDFVTAPRAIATDSSWWHVAPAEGDLQTHLESFEGLPIGDLAGRPGWNPSGIAWEISPGPAGPGTGAAVPTNGFDGGHGQAPGKFDEPMGVGVDRTGNIYVSERLNHRVQKFAADGTYLGEWGVIGSGSGQFREPLDLAVDGDRVYVMDTWNTRIQVFDLTGNFLSQIGPDPVLGKPRGIFVRDGKVYVANSGRDDILVFNDDGSLLAHFPTPESSTLKQVVDLVVDSQGTIFVNNSSPGRIEIYSAGGERLGSFPVAGWEAPHLREFYMAIDDRDVIYITDWDTHRVRRFRTDGTELPEVGPKMNRPSGLAVVGDRLIVAARGDNVLRVVDLSAERER